MRLMRRANKVRSALRRPLANATPPTEKPKNLHWKTYFSLLQQHDALMIAVSSALQERLTGIEKYIEQETM
jgi:hypothetical protein